ncbi:MAG: TraB/GumN family protein [Novosphingobium sp.]
MQFILRRLACLFLALYAFLSIPAWAREPAVAAVAAPVEKAVPALWQVSDADTTIWLFGTIHALPPGIDWFHGPVREAFDGSQELVTEISDTDPLEMQRLILAHAALPPGQTLRDMLTPELRSAYEAQLGHLALPAQAFDGFEPWYAAIALSTLPLSRTGYDAKHGVEQTLGARARELGHRHSALETPAYQIGLFDSLPVEAQKRYFAEVVGKLPTVADDLGRIVAAWHKGDAEELARLMNAEEDDPALLEMLLINRNKAWAAWIAQRLDEPGTVFVAVGAGHLAGPGSLQEQLAARGIVTRRVQ